MIDISCDIENEVLQIRPSGNNFQDLIETLKILGCRWNPKTKYWEKSIADFDNIVDQFTYEQEDIELTELTKMQIEKWKKSLIELKPSTSRRIFNQSLLKCTPLKGEPPYENFQKEDITRAINSNRMLFNWEVGLGKSYALAALIEHLRYYNLIDKCLIFSTGVGVFNLKDELLKFSNNLSADDIFVLNSVRDSKDYDDRDLFNIEKYPQRIIIMTYDSFKGINNYYYDKAKATKKDPHPSHKIKYKSSYIDFEKWLGGKPGAIFLDECHSLSNPKSRRTEIFNMALQYFDYRYLFTGTLADSYEKLYEPLYILDKSLINGRNYTDWLGAYCELGNRFSKYAINKNGWKLDKIADLNKAMLKSYASKRLACDCLNLPLDYDVPTINLDMSNKQRAIYEAFTKEQLKQAQERKRAGESTVSDTLLNMFQIFQLSCDNPECIKSSKSFDKLPKELQSLINDYDYNKDSSKLEALDAIIDERAIENNQKGIIWYFHPDTKDKLIKRYSKYSPLVVEAGMDNDERNLVIKEFKSNPDKKLLIGSINVMNTSVTITEAKWQVYLEKTYNYTVYAQSRGRIHRNSQTEMTRTYDMCYKNSIDYMQTENLKQKGSLIDGLLSKNFIDGDTWKKIFNGISI